MDSSELKRRDFHRLAMAAFGGALAGSVAGCGKDAPPPATPSASPDPLAMSVAAVGVEKHVCRGLNACKNQGASGENDCAGQGTCATVEPHACGGMNACKGQGGCGKNAVENECKGQGGCHVPLMDDVWDKARAILAAKLKKEGKELGAAPAK